MLGKTAQSGLMVLGHMGGTMMRANEMANMLQTCRDSDVKRILRSVLHKFLRKAATYAIY